MKKITLFLLVGITLILWRCSFSAGTNKDLSTGLYYSYNGFSVESVKLAGPDNTAMSDNKVELGTKIGIVVEGIANYELKDDMASPGIMLILTDKDGTAVINEADLFAGSEGYSAEDASILRGTVTIGNPMKSGETYHLKMRVWDKNKSENEITAEVDLVVK